MTDKPRRMACGLRLPGYSNGYLKGGGDRLMSPATDAWQQRQRHLGWIRSLQPEAAPALPAEK